MRSRVYFPLPRTTEACRRGPASLVAGGLPTCGWPTEGCAGPQPSTWPSRQGCAQFCWGVSSRTARGAISTRNPCFSVGAGRLARSVSGVTSSARRLLPTLGPQLRRRLHAYSDFAVTLQREKRPRSAAQARDCRGAAARPAGTVEQNSRNRSLDRTCTDKLLSSFSSVRAEFTPVSWAATMTARPLARSGEWPVSLFPAQRSLPFRPFFLSR